MKAITEDILRYELRSSQPEVYIIPEGKILTPAAREYLQMRKIRFEKEGGYNYKHQLKAPVTKAEEPAAVEKTNPRVVATEVPPQEEVEIPGIDAGQPKPKYVDFENIEVVYVEKLGFLILKTK